MVASKSGTTIETLSLYRYFRDRLEQEALPAPGRHFVAVTDPGSPLLDEARRLGFRRSFEAPADVGGRYSALTVFGLLPMALMGANVDRVVEWTRQLEHECSPGLPESANPAVRLGAALALHAGAGRNKLTLTASPSVSAFPLWIEQLVAESSGKDGEGIVPVTGEALPDAGACSPDRVFVHCAVTGDADAGHRVALEALEAAGHPVYRIELPEPEALGGEFLRWEIATATASAILGVNPFDEPDVATAKRATADLLERWASEGSLPAARTHAFEGGLEIFAADTDDESTPDGASVGAALARWLDQGARGGYVAILGYFDASPERDAAVARLRERLGTRTGLATTFGYGPRYLHSTGQLHKGGPEGGIFLVLTADPVEDLALEEGGFSLGTLQRAQALGDVRTLRERGRHVLHAHLGWDVEAGLETLAQTLDTTA